MRSLLEARSRERWYNPRQFACKPRVIPPLGARWPGQSESTTGIGIEGASKDISHKVRTGILSYMNPLKISENHKIKIEWLMFCMFNCCALPWSLMDCRFFIAFIHVPATNFTVSKTFGARVCSVWQKIKGISWKKISPDHVTQWLKHQSKRWDP